MTERESKQAPGAALRFRIPPPPQPSAAVAYAVAVVVPLAALAVQVALRRWIDTIPFVLFFLVVSIVASVGGWGPGLLSAGVSAACGWFFLSGSPVPDRASGALVSAIVFAPVGAVIAMFGALVRAGFRERDQAARELAQAVRLQEQFISTASHELKTPLTSLVLVVQRLARAKPDSPFPADAKVIESLSRQTSRLTFLVNNLLDVSRITSGRLHLTLEDIDLVQVVRDTAENFEREVALAGSTLSVQAHGTIVGRWDRLRLEQILTNLLSNAIKYGAARPITVAVTADDATAVLTVKDQGIGIPPEDLGRVFERFERGPHGSAPGGFGLGLWIVREIVSALGGTIRLESAPGQGSTFTVSLPRRGSQDGLP
jgi:signal transduction histidine kinase